MNRTEAIRHIYQTRNGLLDELKFDIGEEQLYSLRITGLIRMCMRITNAQSWEITKSGISLAEMIDPPPKKTLLNDIKLLFCRETKVKFT